MLFLLLLAACAPSESIKIGYIGPLTGDAASIGAPGVAAAETAVAEINAQGGVLGKQLELIVEDDGCSSTSVQAMNKLLHVDKVIAISGPDCGASAGPAIPLAQQAGVPVVVRWASVPGLTTDRDFIFRIYPSDAFQGAYAAEQLIAMNYSTVAVLYVQNDYGQGLRDVFVDAFEQMGGVIVLNEGHSQEEIDFKTVLLQVQQENPDVLYLPTYRAAGLAILRQARELGLELPIVAGDAFDTDEIILSEEADGVLYSTAVMNNPEDFRERVFAHTGVAADKVTAPLAYDSIMVIADALERAGSTNANAVREALETTSIDGVTFPVIEFDGEGDFKHPAYTMKIVRDKHSEDI